MKYFLLPSLWGHVTTRYRETSSAISQLLSRAMRPIREAIGEVIPYLKPQISGDIRKIIACVREEEKTAKAQASLDKEAMCLP